MPLVSNHNLFHTTTISQIIACFVIKWIKVGEEIRFTYVHLVQKIGMIDIEVLENEKFSCDARAYI